MKTTVLKIGQPRFDEYVTLTKYYQKRIIPFSDTKSKIIKFSQWDDKFEKSLFKVIDSSNSTLLVSMDEHGKQLSSTAFSENIRNWRSTPQIKQVIFVVGGPYGLPESFVSKSDLTISLSNLVFTSDLAWLLLWEQLYRAHSIINNTPYHHK